MNRYSSMIAEKEPESYKGEIGEINYRLYNYDKKETKQSACVSWWNFVTRQPETKDAIKDSGFHDVMTGAIHWKDNYCCHESNTVLNADRMVHYETLWTDEESAFISTLNQKSCDTLKIYAWYSLMIKKAIAWKTTYNLSVFQTATVSSI